MRQTSNRGFSRKTKMKVSICSIEFEKKDTTDTDGSASYLGYTSKLTVRGEVKNETLRQKR